MSRSLPANVVPSKQNDKTTTLTKKVNSTNTITVYADYGIYDETAGANVSVDLTNLLAPK